MPPPESSRSAQFANDVATLVTGTTVAQILTILASPILTRLFGPEAFGIFTIFLSITGIIGVVACLRYELAIMLPGTDEEAANVLGLCLFFIVIICILTAVALYFGGHVIISLMNAPDLAPYLWLVVPFVFVSGVFLALNQWNTRTRNFKRLSAARVAGSVATTGTQVGAGLSGYTSGGSLIWANLAGSSIVTGILGGQIWRDDHAVMQRGVSRQGVIAAMKRYQRFPILDSGSALLNTISWQLPAYLLSAFFSPVVVGYYALGFRVLQMPMNFIGTSISQVFFQRATEARRDGSLDKLIVNVFRVLVLIGLFPTLIITLIGGDLFAVVFGEIWREAGIYAQILSVWTLIWFISTPLSMLVTVFEKLDWGLKYNFANLILRFLSLLIGGLLGSVYIALGLFALSGILVYGHLFYSLMRLSGVTWSLVYRILLSDILRFVPFGIVILGLKLLNVHPLILVIATLIAGLVYYIYLINTDSRLQAILYEVGMMKYLDRLLITRQPARK